MKINWITRHAIAIRNTFFSIGMLVLSITANAQSKTEKELITAVEKLKKAMVDGDRSQLEALVEDQLSYGHSSGKLENKAAFVESIASGKSDFVNIDLTEQTFKLSGKTAIVRHNLFANTNDGGKPGTVKLGVMLIWQKEHGQWKLLARQAYKI